MRPSNHLHLSHELKQQLKLTPEMRLRLEVLQGSYMELREILNKELQENPILDDVIFKEDINPETTAIEKNKTEDVKIGEKSNMEEIDYNNYDNTFGEQENTGWKEKNAEVNDLKSIDNSTGEIEDSGWRERPETEYNPDAGKVNDYRYDSLTDDRDKDLNSVLIRQLNTMDLEEDIYQAVFNVISMIDDRGFLEIEDSRIAGETGLSPEIIACAIQIIQKFEPTGVGARNVKESLLMQLKEKKMKDSLAYKIIEENFELLSRQQFEKLASIYKTSEENIKKAEEEIKLLSPYPGHQFSGDVKNYIIPDIIVDEDEEGKYHVHIFGEFPQLVVNKEQLELYKSNKETKPFAKKYEENLKTLKNSWDERNKTIKTVVEKILQIQDYYMKNEETGLKPLTLKEVADEIGVHESTISRIVSRKYIQLPGGIKPLKDFFSSKLKGADGDVSSDSVKGKIRAMIDAEDVSSPLTDTQIEEKLKESGINIARRTVSKYREQLEILPASSRKRQ
ncbi:MAG: RNA polymerase sigma-54 factor [Candidatus Goldiibacteriota bacterium HGW-Goldbacteria-1]|nr:MAG: RNA polymerase sigma-54 factor [Candidatus Goldiibacteriota bacterium HGW-Goldbacteria-1]